MKLSRRHCGLILFMFCVGGTLSIVRGQDVATQNLTFLNNISSIISLVLDVIYVLLRPLLVVAGRAMDNSLVLGEVFQLDQALFQFWNMTKNLANFALGFIVLFHIAKHVRKGGENKIIGTIGKAIVAGIGIQVSWFIMIALLDLSTIAIVSVGSMPLSVLDDSTSNKTMIQPVITFNNVGMNNANSTKNLDGKEKKFFSVHYTCSDKKNNDESNSILGTYTPLNSEGKKMKPQSKSMDNCYIHNNYIIARRPDLALQADQEAGKITESIANQYANDPINHAYCVYNQEIYKVRDPIQGNGDITYYYIPLMPYKTLDNVSRPDAAITGSSLAANVFNMLGGPEEEKKRKARSPEDARVTKTDFSCSTFADLKKNATHMAGPLTGIFSSILNFSNITSFSTESAGRLMVIFLIKAITGIMLIIPLITLLIVLIKRVGYLWIALVGGPLIVVYEVFKKDLSLGSNENIATYLSLGKVIGLIFMPVVTIFTMSIGIVFLNALHNIAPSPSNETNHTDILSEFGIASLDPTTDGTLSTSCYKIFFVEVCYESDNSYHSGWGSFLDTFSYLIIHLFGVGVLWMIVFATFKISHVSEGLGDSISKLGKDFALSSRIIPIPGGGSVGLGALGAGGGGNSIMEGLSRHYNNKMRQDSMKFDRNEDADNNTTNKTTKQKNKKHQDKIINSINTTLKPQSTGSAITSNQVSTHLNNTNNNIDDQTLSWLKNTITSSQNKTYTLDNKRIVSYDNNTQQFTVNDIARSTPQNTPNI